MKKTNIVLAFLIMIMALAGAVFSLMFFLKRGDFTQGWDRLAATVHDSSSSMDRNSGTSIASELTPDALAHEKFGDLDRRLPKLSGQSRELITQRDRLAETLSAVAVMGGVQHDKAELTRLATGRKAAEELSRSVHGVIEGRDSTYRNLNNVAKAVNSSVSASQLVSGSNSALNSFESAVKTRITNRNAYENNLKKIAAKLDTSFNPGSNYSEAGAKLLAELTKFQGRYSDIKTRVDQARRESRRLESKLTAQDREIVARQLKISDKDFQIAGFKVALGEQDPAALPRTPWKAGSAEARNALVGKVSDIDRQYGFMTIDFGSKTTVKQDIGGKVIEVNPGLKPGITCLVADAPLTGSPNYVTSVQLETVGDYSSTARIPTDGDSIKVGDTIVVAKEAKFAASKPAVDGQKKN